MDVRTDMRTPDSVDAANHRNPPKKEIHHCQDADHPLYCARPTTGRRGARGGAARDYARHMIAPSTLIAFIAAAFIMVVIPGPTVLFTIGRSIALGRLGGFLSIVGTALGSIVLVLGVALGVGTVIAQ